MLDLNVMGTSSGPSFVVHRKGGFILDVLLCRTFSQGIEFCEDISEMLGGLCSSDFSKDLCLC